MYHQKRYAQTVVEVVDADFGQFVYSSYIQ